MKINRAFCELREQFFSVVLVHSFVKVYHLKMFLGLNHGDIILNRSNNSSISIETSMPHQAGGFIIKHYLGISNIAACR